MIMVTDLDSNLLHSFASIFADGIRVSVTIAHGTDAKSFQNELLQVIHLYVPQSKTQFDGDKFEHSQWKITSPYPHLL